MIGGALMALAGIFTALAFAVLVVGFLRLRHVGEIPG